MEDRMRHPPDVPQLQEYPPAGSVHRIRHQLPASDLRLAVDAGCEAVALPLPRNLRRLGDDQAGTGALGVIPRHDLVRQVARLGTARARHRRHDDAVGQGQPGQIERREKGRGRHQEKTPGKG
jgi:hypothetical protein